MSTTGGYRYVIRRIGDDQIMGELALYNVSFGFALNGYGAMSAKVAMADTLGDAFAWTKPKRFTLCVERDGVLEWCGPIWTRQRDYVRREITIAGNEWGSIYDRRILNTTDIVIPDGLEERIPAIVTLILGHAYLPVGEISLDVVTEGTFTDLLTAFIDDSQHQTVFNWLDTAASNPDDGFHYRWEAAYSGTNAITRSIVMGNPLDAGPGPIFDLMTAGGTVDEYTTNDMETPNDLIFYDSNGLTAWRAIQVGLVPTAEFPTTADLPIDTMEADTLGDDITDDQASSLVNTRLELYNGSGYGGIGVITSVATFRRPPPPSFYPKPGQAVGIVLQDKPGSVPYSEGGLITAKNVTINDDGSSTIALSLGGT